MMRLFRYLMQYKLRDMAEFLNHEKLGPADCDIDLGGKTAVISGTTSGIGLETARLFASRGADLVCLNRNPYKSAQLEEELRNRFGCRVRTIITDFSSLAQTTACADELLGMEAPIDILIHNSGVFYTKRTFTEDGIEMVFQVNHLSSFCLNFLLRQRLREENRARIIHVNSEGYRFVLGGVHTGDLAWEKHRYTGSKSYGAAKTAQILCMHKFREFFSGTAVTINAMHPGNVRSSIGENNGLFYRTMKKNLVLPSAKDPVISAKALYYLSASDEVSRTSGAFFNLTSPETLAPHARDRDAAESVWNKSVELCGLE